MAPVSKQDIQNYIDSYPGLRLFLKRHKAYTKFIKDGFLYGCNDYNVLRRNKYDNNPILYICNWERADCLDFYNNLYNLWNKEKNKYKSEI